MTACSSGPHWWGTFDCCPFDGERREQCGPFRCPLASVDAPVRLVFLAAPPGNCLGQSVHPVISIVAGHTLGMPVLPTSLQRGPRDVLGVGAGTGAELGLCRGMRKLWRQVNMPFQARVLPFRPMIVRKGAIEALLPVG